MGKAKARDRTDLRQIAEVQESVIPNCTKIGFCLNSFSCLGLNSEGDVVDVAEDCSLPIPVAS